MLAACLGGLAFGLLGGFIKIMLPFLLLICGVVLAGTAASAFGPVLPEFLGGEHSRTAVVFLLVLAVLQVLGLMVFGLFSLAMTAATTAVSATPTGALLNRSGGAIAGLIYGCVLLSVFLIALQQIPVAPIADAMSESSFAHGPINWVDRYAPSIGISPPP